MTELAISHAEAVEMAQQKATDSNLARRFIELHAEHARLREAAEAAHEQMCRFVAPPRLYRCARRAPRSSLAVRFLEQNVGIATGHYWRIRFRTAAAAAKPLERGQCPSSTGGGLRLRRRP